MFSWEFWMSVILAPILVGLITHLLGQGKKWVIIVTVCALVGVIMLFAFVFSADDEGDELRKVELVVYRPCAYEALSLDCKGAGIEKCSFRATGEVRGVDPAETLWGYALLNFTGEGMCVGREVMKFHFTTAGGERQWYLDVFMPDAAKNQSTFDLHLVLSSSPVADAARGTCGIEDFERELGINIVGRSHSVVQRLTYEKSQETQESVAFLESLQMKEGEARVGCGGWSTGVWRRYPAEGLRRTRTLGTR